MTLLKYQSIDGLVDREINSLFNAANSPETSPSEINRLIGQVREAKLLLGKAPAKQKQTEKFISECQKNYVLIKARELVSDIDGEIADLSGPMDRVERVSRQGQLFLASDPNLREAVRFFHDFSMPSEVLRLSSKTLDSRAQIIFDRQQKLVKIFSDIFPQIPKENNPILSLAGKVKSKFESGVKQEFIEQELSKIGEGIVRFEDVRQRACEHVNVLKGIEQIAPQFQSFQRQYKVFVSSYREWKILAEKVFSNPMQLENYDVAYEAFKTLSKESKALILKVKQLPEKFVDKKFLEFLTKVANIEEPSAEVLNLPIGIHNLGDLGMERRAASRVQNALETLDWSSITFSEANCFWGLRHCLLDIWRYAIGQELDVILQTPRDALLANRESTSINLSHLEALEKTIPWSSSMKENLARAKRLLPKEEIHSVPEREAIPQLDKPFPMDIERLEKAAAPSVKWTFFDYLSYPFIVV